jgi:hypothetical protein
MQTSSFRQRQKHHRQGLCLGEGVMQTSSSGSVRNTIAKGFALGRV